MSLGSSSTHYFLPSSLPSVVQRIMVFSNMQAKEALRWEVPAAFHAAIDVNLGIMDFISFNGGKRQRRRMRW